MIKDDILKFHSECFELDDGIWYLDNGIPCPEPPIFHETAFWFTA